MKKLSVTLLINDQHVVVQYVPAQLKIQVSAPNFCTFIYTADLLDDSGEYTQDAWVWVQCAMDRVRLARSWDRVEFTRIVKELAA